MTNVERTRQHIQLIRELSNELAQQFHALPDDVWKNAEQYASGCDQWTAADVVTHLISKGMASSLSIARALKGETSPPMGYRPVDGQKVVESVISLRMAFDEDLFPEFYTNCFQLNNLLTSLKAQDYETQAWTPNAIVPISHLIEERLVELAIHGWDTRYGIDRSAGLNEKALPFLTDWVQQRLLADFTNDGAPETSATYRFLLNDSAAEGYDLVISGDEIRLTAADDSEADVTFRCDTDTYILLGTGRLPFARSVRRGRLSFEGNEELASRFDSWFKPL